MKIDAGGHASTVIEAGESAAKAERDGGLRRARGARRAHGNWHQAELGVVTALDPVQALLIGSAVFSSHLENTPRVAVCLLEIVAGRLPDATAQRSAFAASETLGRIAARVVELSRRYGEPGVTAD